MKKIILFTAATFLLALFSITSCKKDDNDKSIDKKIPVLSTSEVSDITQTTAVSGGNITDDGGSTVTARGVCWSTNIDPTISDSKTIDGVGAGSFTRAFLILDAARQEFSWTN